MAVLPKRVIEVDVLSSHGEIVSTGAEIFTIINLRDLRMEFEISRTRDSAPDEGYLRIWNLKESTANFIEDLTDNIRIRAGYGEAIGTVFYGDIRNTTQTSGTAPATMRTMEGADSVLELQLGGSVDELVSAFFNRTYSGTVSRKQVIREVAETFNLPSTGIDNLLDSTLENFTFTGRSTEALDLLMEAPYPASWHEENGVIKFVLDFSDEGFEALALIEEGNGLLGSPEILDDGIAITTVMNASFSMDEIVRVKSTKVPRANGDWRVRKMIIKGTNSDGDFNMYMELEPLNEQQ